MNPQLAALIQEYLADGSASNLEEAYALAMKNSGFTNSVGQIGGNVANTAAPAATAATRLGGPIRQWFGKNFNAPGSEGPLFKGNLNIPSLKAIRDQSLYEGGPSMGGLARGGMALYQGANALKGLYENTGKDSEFNSLKNDVNTAIASNPMYDMYLDASDEKLLRQLKSGSLNTPMNGAANGAIKGVPKALISALIGGMAGGGWGAAINGLGSLANSVISGYGEKLDENSGKLQGLYSKLRQAQSDYKTMKRPTGLGAAGLQTRYFNQMY